MATNLKKGKQISAFICRMLTFCAFLCMIASAVAGRNALHAFSQAGIATITGDFYYLPQFQSYMETYIIMRYLVMQVSGMITVMPLKVPMQTTYPPLQKRAFKTPLQAKREISHMPSNCCIP